MKRFILASLFLILPICNSEAAPENKYKAALTSAKSLNRSEAGFKKKIAALNTADRDKLKKATAKLGEDSDQDGVSDIFESARGSNKCDSDSDDDGVSDDEDKYEDDEDRVTEVKAKGRVVSFNDPNLVVGAKTFAVTDSTAFRKGLSSKADLEQDVCIEVEGYSDASNSNVASKIQGSRDCAKEDDSGSDD